MKLELIKTNYGHQIYVPKKEAIKFGWKHHLSKKKGRYNDKNIRFIKSLPLDFERGTVLDIGANIGITSLDFAGMFAYVHAFEPHPTTFDILNKNIQKNSKLVTGGIDTHNLGLGNIIGKLKFSSYAFDGYNHIDADGTLEVNVTTVDRFMSEELDELGEYPGSISFVKIDVEGYELPVLQGMIDTIELHKPVIQAEILAKCTKRFGYKPEDIFKFMKKQGYNIFDANGNKYTKWIDVSKLSKTEKKKYRGVKDYFFIPKNRKI